MIVLFPMATKRKPHELTLRGVFYSYFEVGRLNPTGWLPIICRYLTMRFQYTIDKFVIKVIIVI